MDDPRQDSTHGGPRFTLSGLLEVVAGLALCLGLVTQLDTAGWVMAFLGLATIVLVVVVASRAAEVAAHLRQGAAHLRQGVFHYWEGIVVVLIVIVVWVLWTSGAERSLRIGRFPSCPNNLRQLGLALHNYHDVNGHFPPAYLADANGKPMHSWRVLILPYLELNDLYRAYNFNEPWDGPNNRKLAAKMPDSFRCPADKALPPGMTSYFAVVGPGRTKPGKQRLELEMDDISDGPDSTIALVESSTARVNWLDPRELTVDDIVAGENTIQRPCPCSLHGSPRGMWRRSGYFYVAMYDAAVRSIPASVDPQTLKALLTIDGGELLDIRDVPSSGDTEYLWPGFWVLVAAEVAFVIFAVVRRVRRARAPRA